MRRTARILLLVLAFSIPWEYSLDFGEPFGNIARLTVIGGLLAIIPAILREGRLRTPGVLQILAIVFLVWLCLSCFWSIHFAESLRQLRGYLQEIVIVWLVWELVESPADLRWVTRAYVAGACILALLTIFNFLSAATPEQVRFVAEGQDPNDVARFLDLAFPLAALLVGAESNRMAKLASAMYLPLGVLGVLLTASRSGLISAAIALSGCAVLLLSSNSRALVTGASVLPILLASAWAIIPVQTIARLATIPNELVYGDLNQRADIWAAGWQAFTGAPLLGYGVGSFVAAAGLAPIDTAHNTVLVLLVEGGVVSLFIAATLAAFAIAMVLSLRGTLRIALGAGLAAWMVSSFAGTVQQNRATWLLLGAIAVAARLNGTVPEAIARTFPRRMPRLDAPCFTPPPAQEQF